MENTQTVIVPSSGVTGDITSCKIESQKIAVERKSIFSLQQKTTYASYDVCSKQIIREYTVPEMTDAWLTFTVLFIVLSVIVAGAFALANTE